MRVIATAVLAAVVAACGGAGQEQSGGVSGAVAEGELLYQQTCAACHGADLNGTDSGPPFLDPIYAPDHHPDQAFLVAAEFGVRPHHWDFGPMPKQPVSEDEVRRIIAYIRSVQRREGIAP